MESVSTSEQFGAVVPLGRSASVNTHEIHHNDGSVAELRRAESLNVAIVDDRLLIRDCLGRSLVTLEPGLKLTYLSKVGEFEDVLAEQADGPGMLLIVMTSLHSVELIVSQISRVKSLAPETKVVVLSETESVGDILLMFDCGASGYIPPSLGIEVTVKVLQLVAAGGVYVPASILSCCSDLAKQDPGAAKMQNPGGEEFTSKQMAVIEALRRGKANKIIAYELNMCESTVKVHVRNVMKKLRARNRTEAAYILNEKLGLPARVHLQN